MSTTVEIYEDNAGSLFLHATDGRTVYTLPDTTSDVSQDAAYVSDNPDGDDGHWGPDLQHPVATMGLDDLAHIATWDQGAIVLNERPGRAGLTYLGLEVER